jgi:hypothetical protein
MTRYRRLARLLTVLVPLAAAAATATPASAVTAPDQDPFYTPPAGFQHTKPGTILRSRQVTMSGPQAVDNAKAYQLLFRTTNATGQPAAAVTTVLTPSSPASGTRVLASYQTAYDSLTLKCAPSYTMQDGNGSDEETYIASELAQGWDVNVPDYEGLQSEWAVGPMLGRATLDSIRAAEHFPADGLVAGVRSKVALTGYSGGSEAATWAGSLAPKYAPELNLVGIAAGGNFPDFDYTTAHLDGSVWYGTEIGVMESFSRAYPDFRLKKFLNAAGLALAASDGTDASGCAGSTLNEPYGNASQFTNFPSSAAMAANPLFSRVMARMSLRYAPYPKTPTYLYNAVTDELAFIEPVDALVQQYCAAGVTVDYDRDPAGGEHVSAFQRYWPTALQYLQNRFAGQAPPDNCFAYNGVPSPPGD